MRKSWGVAISMLLMGCGEAGASELDSKNPTHCYAAMNFAHFHAKKDGKAELLPELEARELFEAKKAEADGVVGDRFLTAGRAATLTLAENPRRAWDFVEVCSKAEDADPYFQQNRDLLLSTAKTHPQSS